MKILHLDSNHPLLIRQLEDLGFNNIEDYTSSKEEIESVISEFDGIVIRSRFSIDKSFIDAAKNLKFIARVGAGLENIDCDYAEKKGIQLIAAPEGNRNAVAEHALGMLLALMNNLRVADKQVRHGQWLREANRGIELDGKTVGIIGYGNMGKAFAKKLKGFSLKVLCYDIKEDVGDENSQQVTLKELQERAQVISLHVPQTSITNGMVNSEFINQFKHPFYLINTARGKCVKTKDLVEALNQGKILGAGLDVLEFEKSSFESLFVDGNIPSEFEELLKSEKVILSPHVAGWSVESHQKLAQTIVDKIRLQFS